MRRIIFSIFSLVFSMFAYAATENYTLDPNHTYVLWTISHFGFSNPSGKWMATGKLVLDPSKPENSHVNAAINVADMITGIPALDKHLKGPLFFDVAKYPTATFVSDKVEVTSKTDAKVHGLLTLHGVSKPITLNMHLNKSGENPVSNKMTVGFSADTTLNRSDFGMNTLSPGLGDQVTLHIEAEANRP